MQRSERLELETFLRLFGQFDVGGCEFSDRPDLIIRGTTPIVGVEHTRIFKNNPDLPSGRQQKPQERFQQQIADRARATFRQTSSLRVHLTVSFAEPSDYRAGDVSTVADELAQSVSQVIRLFGTHALQNGMCGLMSGICEAVATSFHRASIRFISRFTPIRHMRYGAQPTAMRSPSYRSWLLKM